MKYMGKFCVICEVELAPKTVEAYKCSNCGGTDFKSEYESFDIREDV